jgi:hypothetical protein
MSDDKIFLKWLFSRLVDIHGENPNVDYMLRFKRIIAEYGAQAERLRALLGGCVRKMRYAAATFRSAGIEKEQCNDLIEFCDELTAELKERDPESLMHQSYTEGILKEKKGKRDV